MSGGGGLMRFVRFAQAAAVGGVVGYGLQATLPFCRNLVGDSFEVWSYPALFVLAAMLCGARCTVPGGRAPWAIMGAGLLASAAGDVYWNLAIGDANPPVFSVADALWLAFYPACLVGLALLARERVAHMRAGLAIDGLIGALGLTAVGAALVFGGIQAEKALFPDDFLMDAVMFFGDLVLLGATIAVLAVTAWRPGRALAFVAPALVFSAVVDGFSIWQGATGTDVKLTGVETLLPAAAVLIGIAAWQPPARRLATVTEGPRAIALSAAFAGAALALLVVDRLTPINPLALALAVATLVAVIARMGLALAQNSKLLAASRTEALTDALTGLANRRRLMADLEAVAARATVDAPHALMMFDLDGFKHYNDWHGHPAGDALLRSLGGRLDAAVGPGARAYRLGGDEFCVIAEGGELDARRTRGSALEALSDTVDGFEVASSCGLVLIPAEAGTGDAVLQLADERLYAQKARRRRFSVSRQTSSALVQALEEREPELRFHLEGVADLARPVAEELGVTGEELDEVVRAAELHDVGKVAVPDAILRKPGPLTETEWGFMREHTLVGDRILSAAPALQGVARLVRSSHERYDGRGYPDRLMGEEIPLGARIVTVCDSFNAMTTDRPYRPAVSAEEALEEIERCSGRQFDPMVVDAFTRLVGPRLRQRERAASGD
jgi:two-component system cell cycle response regulator